MRRRWYYWKQTLRANRPFVFLIAGVFLVLLLVSRGWRSIGNAAGEWFRSCGVQAAGKVMKDWLPAAGESDENGFLEWFSRQNPLVAYLSKMDTRLGDSEDPAYERLLAEEWIKRENRIGVQNGAGDQSGLAQNGVGQGQTGDGQSGSGAGNQTGLTQSGTGQYELAQDQTEAGADGGTGAGQSELLTGEVIARRPASQVIIREKLADYDYMMQTFYSVHPTTTAGRDLMSAERFLSMDFSLEKTADAPQILIYHTHSQEEFSDYPGNPEATIVGVGSYLAELLEEKGYTVLHDTSVYDVRDGKLDRSKAYTYALDGITGILQKYPSIEVVLDIHRDGVQEGTHLVTEVNGKPTAQIMFFNGTSQTPDGPIEYLPNPNREANMAFSFQMQLLAAEQYPGFTRKIYLKGLRYNMHVRARSALIEVGAQTNTYEEARNAMEPLAKLLDEVLAGGNAAESE